PPPCPPLRPFPTRRSSDLPAEIRRADLSSRDDPLDRADHAVVELAMAQVVEHQGAGPDGADGIGDPPARDVRGGSVNRLEHRRIDRKSTRLNSSHEWSSYA